MAAIFGILILIFAFNGLREGAMLLSWPLTKVIERDQSPVCFWIVFVLEIVTGLGLCLMGLYDISGYLLGKSL